MHASGTPWDDASGDRLREWTGLTPERFYDPARLALMPMGFCYPGTAKGADLPPRAECAPLWHGRLRGLLPADIVTLLVGTWAQARYLPGPKGRSLTDTVRAGCAADARLFPLPHPSWRSTGWMRRNPWFEADILPRLRPLVASLMSD